LAEVPCGNLTSRKRDRDDKAGTPMRAAPTGVEAQARRRS
jgi:hypothetical protein